MAISSTGLDVASIVKQLTAAERAPFATRINRGEAGAKARLSSFATLGSAFDNLKNALGGLKNLSAFGARSTKSPAETVFTASVGSNVPAGSYEIEVLATAKADKLVSAAFADDAPIGQGRLGIRIGEAEFEVELGEAQNTPAEVRDAINKAAEASGARIQASLVRSDDGVHVVLSGRDTGAAQAIQVTRLEGDESLDALTHAVMTRQNTASDAQVRVDGLLRSSSSNQITDAVPGLSLNLRSADAGTVHVLAVTVDNAPARSAMQSLVNAYNSAVTAMNNATRYDPTSNTPAALTGDALVRGASGVLRNTLAEALGSAAENGLGSAQLGLSTNVDGTLKFDAAKFESALAADEAGVRAAIGGENGLAGKLSSAVERYVGPEGLFTSRRATLDDQIKGFGAQREALDRRMEAVEVRYRNQFTALDALIAQLNNTSGYLAQQLDNLPGMARR